MSSSDRSYALAELSWVDVAARLERDRRLLVPVGVCDQFGPHLPIAAATPVVESLARDLAQEFEVLYAPTFAYGVNVPTERIFAGSATLREKTLHRALNDLLADWEEQGFNEFILLTAHCYDPHLEALATVAVAEARIRVINALAIDPPDESVVAGPEHGGQKLTSLLLHLRPELVRMEAAVDVPLPVPRFPSLSRRRIRAVPVESPGSVGPVNGASAEAGALIYAHILEKIRDRVFLSPDEEYEEEEL
jgi:creatinine amidohydrolase/Fe(II)-dependent formamide hydrolase-like protein